MTATNEQRTPYGKAGSDSFYRKCSRGALTFATGLLALLIGSDASPQQYAKTPIAYRVQQEQQKPDESAGQETQRERKPQEPQRPKLPQEVENARIAGEAYLEGKKLYDANKVAESRPHFLKAHKYYVAAENSDPKDALYVEEVKNILDWVSVSHYNKNIGDLTPEERAGLDKLIAEYDKPADPQDPPKPKVNLEEVRLETAAVEAYNNGLKAERADKGAALKHFLDARLGYKKAESADPASEKYAQEIYNTTDRIVSARHNGKKLQELSVAELNDLALLLEKYEKEGVVLAPVQPKPEPKPQDPPKLPDAVPAEPKVKGFESMSVPVWCQQCLTNQKGGPFYDNYLSLRGIVGPESRELAAALRLEGIAALGRFSRNDYEDVQGDKVETSGIEIYAAADLKRMLDIPLRVDAHFGLSEDVRESFAQSVADDPNFNITTRNFTSQVTTRTRFGIGGELALGDTELSLRLYNSDEDIDVGVLTELNVINKNDPAGSFQDTIRNRQSFLNTTFGVQAGISTLLSDEVSGGLLFTMEDIDMPDFNRDVQLYRGHLWLHYLNNEGTRGFHLVAGQGLLDDDGERITKGEYGAVAGMKLDDLVSTTFRFSKLEDPRGALTLLLGRAPNALRYMLENDVRTMLSDLNLDPRMGRGLQRYYVEMHNRDLVRWLANKREYQLLATGEIAELELLGENRTVYNWDFTALLPLFEKFTIGVRVYKWEDIMSDRQGVELLGLPIGKGWWIEAMGEEMTLPGQREKDRRGLAGFGIRF